MCQPRFGSCGRACEDDILVRLQCLVQRDVTSVDCGAHAKQVYYSRKKRKSSNQILSLYVVGVQLLDKLGGGQLSPTGGRWLRAIRSGGARHNRNAAAVVRHGGSLCSRIRWELGLQCEVGLRLRQHKSDLRETKLTFRTPAAVRICRLSRQQGVQAYHVVRHTRCSIREMGNASVSGKGSSTPSKAAA